MLKVGSVELVAFPQHHEAALHVLPGHEGDAGLRGGSTAGRGAAEAAAARQVVEEGASLAQPAHRRHRRAQAVHLGAVWLCPRHCD